MALHPESAEPLYLQIRNELLSWIRSGKYRPHDKIPSERELCQHFGVSRMTVRQALSKLAEDGVVYSRHGKGLFLAPPGAADQLAFVLTGFNQDGSALTSRLVNKILSAQVVPATSDLMEAFGLSFPEELIRLERLRLFEGIAIAYQTLCISQRLCPDLLSRDLTRGGLLQILHDDCHLPLQRVRQVVRAGYCRAHDAGYLGIPPAAPVLLVERKTLLDSGEVVEVSTGAHRPEYFQYIFSIDVTRWTPWASNDLAR